MSRKFKIVLHIGTEKTGTTTLQKVLLDNKEHLLKEGVYYLHGEGLDNSRDIAAACIDDGAGDDYLDSKGISSPEERQAYRKRLKKVVHDKIDNLPEIVHTILISSEHFHSRLLDVSSVVFLKEWLKPYANEFKVFCYLRRQVDLVTSFYSTELKEGGSRSLDECAKSMLKEKNHYCNYDIFLSKWEEVFSKDEIRVKCFERSGMIGGSVVDDFLDDAGVSPDCILEKTKSTNESITHLGQVLLQKINAYNFSGNHGGEKEKEKEKKRIRRLIAKDFQGKGRKLPPSEAKKLQSLFDDSNERVRARWFPERAVLFDSDFSEDECRDLSDAQEHTLSSIITYVATAGEKIAELSNFDHYVESIKSAAVEMETKKPTVAYDLYSLACVIRPDGPLIRRKKGELKVKLAEKD